MKKRESMSTRCQVGTPKVIGIIAEELPELGNEFDSDALNSASSDPSRSTPSCSTTSPSLDTLGPLPSCNAGTFKKPRSCPSRQTRSQRHIRMTRFMKDHTQIYRGSLELHRAEHKLRMKRVQAEIERSELSTRLIELQLKETEMKMKLTQRQLEAVEKSTKMAKEWKSVFKIISEIIQY